MMRIGRLPVTSGCVQDRMSFHGRLVVLAFAVLLAGCATGPRGVPITSAALQQAVNDAPEAGYGRLIVYFGGSVPGQVISIPQDLRVNDNTVGALSDDDFADLLMGPGTYKLSISDANTFLGYVTVVVGETQYFSVTQCNVFHGGCYPTRLRMASGSREDFFEMGHSARRIFARIGVPVVQPVSKRDVCIGLGYSLGTIEFADCMLRQRGD